MKRSTSFLTVLGVAGWVATASAAVDPSQLPAPSTRKGLTFEKDIQPLFEASCTGCHGEKRAKGDLRLDSLAAVLKGGEDGKVVVVGKSKESPLVLAISCLDDETAMPPKRKGPPGGPGGPGGPRPEGARPEGARPPGGPGGPRPEGGRPPGGPGGGPGGPGGPGFKPPQPLTAEQVGLVRAWIDQGAK